MSNFEEVACCLKKGKKAVICGHEMPDGDSVGSVLAMGFLLSGMGVENYVLSTDRIPAVYDFLPRPGEILTLDKMPENCDLAVILDCTDLNRLQKETTDYIAKIPVVVNIDHHISNQVFGNCNYVDAKASATGEIVFDLIKYMGLPLTHEIAENLYTAIVMDSGSFRFENTSYRTHAAAAELVRTGLDIADINKNLFEKKEFVHLKLLGYALENLKVAVNGRVAWVAISAESMQRVGASDEHADGIINYPRMLDGVEIGLMFKEISPGRVKVGFRSKKYVDVNKLASVLGGGGHPRAAGCLVEGSLEEVEKRVIDLCAQVLEKEPGGNVY